MTEVRSVRYFGPSWHRLKGPRRRTLTANRSSLRLIALTTCLLLSTGGCSEIIPRFELRDDYMFKRFFQPNRVVSEIRHDENGNPILEPPGRFNLPKIGKPPVVD
ncbi:MAG: hypothetical protein HQ495_12150 [Alphaproteobacteria bacterium]|nr:hypothetical protein [Alphaproteobacteria bacterium]